MTFLGSPNSNSSRSEVLLTQIADFENTAQVDLERMVVTKDVDVAAINERVAFFSSQLDTLNDEELQIASTILSRVAQAVALVKMRQGESAPVAEG